jgi:hypothetical protein
MTDPPSQLLEGLDLDLARRIDALCRRFEAERRDGRAPSIGDYLDEIPREGRAALRAELMALERELGERTRRWRGRGACPDHRGPHHRVDKVRCPSRPGGSPRNLRASVRRHRRAQGGSPMLRSIRLRQASLGEEDEM